MPPATPATPGPAGPAGDTVDIGPRGASPAKLLLIGCAAVLLFAAVVLGVGAYVVGTNWRSWAAGATRAGLAEAVGDMELPEQDRAALLARVDRLTDEFERERLTLGEVREIAEAFVASPIMPVIAVEGIQRAYIAPADLTEAEKARARRLNQRLARGIYEKRITGEQLSAAIEPLADEGRSAVTITTDGDGAITNFQIRIKPPDETTPDELRAFMANAEGLLEREAIPDEPFTIDVVAEFDAAVEKAIGRPLLPPGAGQAAGQAAEQDAEQDAEDQSPAPGSPGGG